MLVILSSTGGKMKLYNDDNKKELAKLVGSNVRYYRNLYNLNHKEQITQAALAEMIGVSTGLIGTLESEKQIVSVPVLWNISQVLDIRMDQLFEEPKIK